MSHPDEQKDLTAEAIKQKEERAKQAMQAYIALEDVIAQIKDLPTISTVAQELMSHLDDEQCSLETICEKVSLDQSLAAKTLRLANSSYYGANSKVVTIQQAVSMLGITNVKNLIRLTIIAEHFQGEVCAGFDFKSFWRHSVATAICAELISRHLHMKHDFAFTAGLLHDIGRLVLVTRFPKEYEAVLNYQKQNDCPLLNAERAILNTDHVIAGFILAMHWQFSDAIQDAIRGHHQPDEPGLNSIASIIHVANSIVHGLDLTQSTNANNDMVPDICQSAWDSLALAEADYHAIFKETSLRFEGIDQIV